MRSAELARQAGVNVQTLRYYERRGLLPEPVRLVAGMLGVAATIWPASLPWYRAGAETVVYLVIFAAGFAFERAVARRAARR